MKNFLNLPVTKKDINQFNAWFKKRSNDSKYKAIEVNINSENQLELNITRAINILKHYYSLFFHTTLFDFGGLNNCINSNKENQKFFNIFNRWFLKNILDFKILDHTFFKCVSANLIKEDFSLFNKKDNYSELKKLFSNDNKKDMMLIVVGSLLVSMRDDYQKWNSDIKKKFLNYFNNVFLLDNKNQHNDFSIGEKFFKIFIKNKNHLKKELKLLINLAGENNWPHLKEWRKDLSKHQLKAEIKLLDDLKKQHPLKMVGSKTFKAKFKANIYEKKKEKKKFIDNIFGFYMFFDNISIVTQQVVKNEEIIRIFFPADFWERISILRYFNGFINYISWSWVEDKFKNKCQSYYATFKTFFQKREVNSIFIDYYMLEFFDNLEKYLENKSSVNILSCIIYNFVFIESLFHIIAIYEKKDLKIHNNNQKDLYTWRFKTIPREIELLLKFFLFEQTEDENNFTSKGDEYDYCVKDFKRNHFIHMNFEKLNFFNQNKLKEIYEILVIISFLFLECFICNTTRQLVLLGKVWSAWNMNINLHKKFSIPINFIINLYSSSIKRYLIKNFIVLDLLWAWPSFIFYLKINVYN